MSADTSEDSQPSISSSGLQQTVSQQAQHTAEPHSDQQQPESSTSSADISDEEASSSDSNGERLWDMTPQQLEGLKVCCSTRKPDFSQVECKLNLGVGAVLRIC